MIKFPNTERSWCSILELNNKNLPTIPVERLPDEVQQITGIEKIKKLLQHGFYSNAFNECTDFLQNESHGVEWMDAKKIYEIMKRKMFAEIAEDLAQNNIVLAMRKINEFVKKASFDKEALVAKENVVVHANILLAEMALKYGKFFLANLFFEKVLAKFPEHAYVQNGKKIVEPLLRDRLSYPNQPVTKNNYKDYLKNAWSFVAEGDFNKAGQYYIAMHQAKGATKQVKAEIERQHSVAGEVHRLFLQSQAFLNEGKAVEAMKTFQIVLNNMNRPHDTI